jgi:hypothetical protein
MIENSIYFEFQQGCAAEKIEGWGYDEIFSELKRSINNFLKLGVLNIFFSFYDLFFNKNIRSIWAGKN